MVCSCICMYCVWLRVGNRLREGGSKGDRLSPEELQAFEQPEHHDHHAQGHGSYEVAFAMYVCLCVHGVYVVENSAVCVWRGVWSQ